MNIPSDDARVLVSAVMVSEVWGSRPHKYLGLAIICPQKICEI